MRKNKETKLQQKKRLRRLVGEVFVRTRDGKEVITHIKLLKWSHKKAQYFYVCLDYTPFSHQPIGGTFVVSADLLYQKIKNGEYEASKPSYLL